jgi:4-diphosphocytidyl-2-C-methyl-D-erythritol kinase
MGRIVFPNAKINIGLHVTGKRPDGFHDLETIFYPIGWHDTIELELAGETELVLYGRNIAGSPHENLVLRAYHLLGEKFDLPAIRFHLLKTIPTGAGLGGGSADAAFTLKLLNETFQLGLTSGQLEVYASELGSDCAFFIQNKPVFATGKGNEFQNIQLDLSAYKIMAIHPGIPVSTAEAYRNVEAGTPAEDLKSLIDLPVKEWTSRIVNDFEKPVFKLFPEIAGLKQSMYEANAIFASMSGSGSAVYGIFEKLPEGKTMESLIKPGYQCYYGTFK